MQRNYDPTAWPPHLAVGLAFRRQAAQEIDSVVKKLQATNTITLGLPRDAAADVLPRRPEEADRLCDRDVHAHPRRGEGRAEAAADQGRLRAGEHPEPAGPGRQRHRRSSNAAAPSTPSPATSRSTSRRSATSRPSQLLVLKSSGIAKFEDLNGKIVAVATGGSSEPELKHIIEDQQAQRPRHQRRRSRRRR